MLLAAAPIFAIQTAREVDRRRAFEADVAEQAVHLAELAAAQQDRLIDGVRYLLVAIAALPEAHAKDGAACSARLRQIRSRALEIAWLGAVDETGALYCTSHVSAE